MVYHNKCCVPHCDGSNEIRHRFPDPSKDLVRFNKWIQAINNLELLEMNQKKVYDSKRLCHQHFESQYISNWSHKLFANAVPTLNLPGISSTGSNDICDTPSTSTKSIQNISSKYSTEANTQLSEPGDSVIGISEWTNPADSIKGNTGNALLPPYQLLKQTGIERHTITPKKKKMYEAMKQLRKKYTMERNKKNSFRRRLFKSEQFRNKHHLEENFSNKIKLQANKIRMNRIKKKNAKQPKHVIAQAV